MLFLRVVHSLLLVTGILACPERCMAAAASEAESFEEPAHCACCPHQSDRCRPDSDQESPASPVNDDCGDCLCKGAVLASAGGKIDLDAAILPNGLAVTADLGAPALTLAAGPNVRHILLIPLESGRQIRLFVESLLL